MKTGNKLTVLSLSLIFVVSACTKPRQAEIKDEGLQESLFAITELQNKTFEIQTGELVTDLSVNRASVETEKPTTKIVKTNAPKRLQKVFKSININAQSGQNYPVQLTVDREYVNVFKVVTEQEELSRLERQLAVRNKNQLIVPIFKIAIQDKGVLVRAKNDNKEETSTLILKSTDFEEATHIVISTKTEAALKIGATPNQKDEIAQLYLNERIDGQVSTLAEFVENFKLALSPINDGLIVTKTETLSGGRANVFVFRLVKKSEITDEVLRKKLLSNSDAKEIALCPADVLAQIKDQELKSQCVMVLSFQVGATNARVELAKASVDGVLSSDIQIKPEISARPTGLIKIAEGTPVEALGKEVLENLNPFNTIRVVDIKNKEFLLRRTFEDGASSIMVFGPGASGDLDIIKFDLQRDRLVVKRVETVNGDKKPGSIDQEELMSIPARYLKRDLTSGSIHPRLQETSIRDAEYISLEWSNNRIPVLNSPLAFFDAGQCFLAVGNQEVKDMDNRLQNGVLNFSIEGSYTFTPDCMSWYGLNDYWYGGNLQGTFNIKERVSFKAHNQSLDNNSAREMPFRAQTLMNYGIFTTGKINPDEYGNSITIGTERALPVVHDFSNNKQLEYILGGLPAEGSIRQAIIDGTKEVVEDWNKALAKAFSGTELARDLSKDPAYIVLKIDGVDVHSGHLGDLDRNYIWNFEKNLDSGLLGMSQAGPNPRSGRIEQNNVLMYSGNLLSQIGYLKELSRITKEYEALKARAYEELMAQNSNKEAEAEEGDVSESDENLLEIVEGANGLNDAQKRKLLEIAVRNSGKLSSQIKKSRSLPEFKVPQMQMKPGARAALVREAQKFAKDTNTSIIRKNRATSQLSQNAFLRNILQKALEEKSTKDPLALQAISASEVLKAYAPMLSQSQKDALALQTRRLALMAEFHKNFHKGPNCAMTAQLNVDAKSSKMDEPIEVLFKDFYKSTLAHEIGHSLGLTHNFMGSTDKANFKFNGESGQRNYSSIMDYISDEKINYAGPGPYDVRALRVSYTGLVELHPGLAQFKQGNKVVVKDRNTGEVVVEVPVRGNLEVTLDDYQKVILEGQSWWKLDAAKMQKLPLKPYRFCTDIHVGGDPACNRWDTGTNLYEISKHYSQEYKDLYPVLNHIGNRTNIRGLGSYVGRLFYQMFNMRFFMDETFYRAIVGYPEQGILEAAYGALNSLFTFNEIIGTPSTYADFYSTERFFLHKYQYAEMGPDGPVTDPTGQPVLKEAQVLVEAKATQDLAVPGADSSHVATRGIEFDKAIAMMMLTERSWGHPRYESIGLRISYPEFEKYFLGLSEANSLTLQNLTSILKNQPFSMVVTPHGPQVIPVGHEITEMLRFYSILSSTVSLHSDAAEDKYNFASLFKVGNSIRSAPQDRITVAKLDQSLNSPTSLKLWAFDNANLSHDMVREAAKARALTENLEALGGSIQTLSVAISEANQEAIKQAFTTLVGQINQANTKEELFTNQEITQAGAIQKNVLASLEVTNSQEAMLDEMVKTLGPFVLQILPALGPQLAEQINAYATEIPVAFSIGTMKARYSGEISEFVPPENWEEISETEEGKAMINAWLRKTVGQIWAQQLLSTDELSSQHGVILGNLESMNQILGFMGLRNSNE